MTKQPVREQTQVNIRMPDSLREKIKASADKNNRSMNAEIVARLEESTIGMHKVDDALMHKIIDETIVGMIKQGFILPSKNHE